MTRHLITCALPGKEAAVAILGTLSPPLAGGREQVLLEMLEDYDTFVRSVTFLMNDGGKRATCASEWLDHVIYGPSVSDEAVCRFEQDPAKRADARRLLLRILSQYAEQAWARAQEDQIDTDPLVDEFRKERIQDTWPRECRRRRSEAVIDNLGALSHEKLREIDAAHPEEPPDSYLEPFSKW